MTLVDSSNCPNCGHDEETVAHFIGQCPRFMQLRGNYLETFYASVNDIFDQISLSKIVRFALKTKRFLIPENSDESGVT